MLLRGGDRATTLVLDLLQGGTIGVDDTSAIAGT